MNTPFSPHDLHPEELLDFALELTHNAGKLALSRQQAAKGSRKPDRTWVSQADLEVQQLIREGILAQYPHHAILAEEEDGHQRPSLCNVQDALWVVDPIDGTESYLRQMPIWSICLGLALHGRPALGVVATPQNGEVFYALAKGPAMRNDQHIRVSEDGKVDRDALLLAPSKMHKDIDCDFPGKLRAYGSTAAHICYVAGGGATAAVMANSKPWDLFAAGVILEAAGGGFFDQLGEGLKLSSLITKIVGSPPLVATRQAIAMKVFSTLHFREFSRGEVFCQQRES